MELIKKNIHMNRLKGNATSQITLNDDFIVPDIKPDIDWLIKDCSELKIDDVKVSKGKITVKGRLCYKVLYCSNSQGRRIHNLAGELPFEEVLNMDVVSESDSINLKWDIEDMSVGIINTRKISVKAIVMLSCSAEELYDIEAATGIDNSESTEYIRKSVNITGIAVCKKDIFRVKEEIDIGTGRPNVQEILWNSVAIRNQSIRINDDSLSLLGDVSVFIVYESEDENAPIQWLESTVSFNGMVDVAGAHDFMIPDTTIKIVNSDVDIRPDYDGEQRVIGLDLALDLDIRLYEESSVDMLSDVYSPSLEIIPTYNRVSYKNVLLKNTTKCKVSDKVKVPSVMQICSCEGAVKIDDFTITEDGLLIDGIIKVSVLYIGSEDTDPLRSVKTVIPFSPKIDIAGIRDNAAISLNHWIENISASMTGNDEMEIKASILLEVLAFSKMNEDVITDLKYEPLDIEAIKNMPGIVGYLVKDDDTLWKIAKKYHTTVDNIKNTNSLTSENLKEGDRIILVKQLN